MGAVTPGETLGTLYNIHVGSNKTKQRDQTWLNMNVCVYCHIYAHVVYVITYVSVSAQRKVKHSCMCSNSRRSTQEIRSQCIKLLNNRLYLPRHRVSFRCGKACATYYPSLSLSLSLSRFFSLARSLSRACARALSRPFQLLSLPLSLSLSLSLSLTRPFQLGVYTTCTIMVHNILFITRD